MWASDSQGYLNKALQTEMSGQFTLVSLILLVASGKTKNCACKAPASAPSCKSHAQRKWSELHFVGRMWGKDAGPAPFCSENGTFLMPPSVSGKVAQDFMANVEGLRDESLLGVYPKHLVLFYFLTLPLIEGFFFCFQKSLNCVVWSTLKAANLPMLLTDF